MVTMYEMYSVGVSPGVVSFSEHATLTSFPLPVTSAPLTRRPPAHPRLTVRTKSLVAGALEVSVVVSACSSTPPHAASVEITRTRHAGGAILTFHCKHGAITCTVEDVADAGIQALLRFVLLDGTQPRFRPRHGQPRRPSSSFGPILAPNSLAWSVWSAPGSDHRPDHHRDPQLISCDSGSLDRGRSSASARRTIP